MLPCHRACRRENVKKCSENAYQLTKPPLGGVSRESMNLKEEIEYFCTTLCSSFFEYTFSLCISIFQNDNE